MSTRLNNSKPKNWEQYMDFGSKIFFLKLYIQRNKIKEQKKFLNNCRKTGNEFSDQFIIIVKYKIAIA